jgi:uncharacterized membrane protein YedE/YeeE
MPVALDLTTAPLPRARAAIQWLPLVAGLGAVAFGASRLAQDGSRPLLLWLIGVLLGLTLYHASFGFASGYRRMFAKRDMRGVQAQLLLLALTTLLFAPVLAGGSAFGHDVAGAWAPVGVSVAVGAFLFGIGMQLAGGCGSGTLYTAGGGSLRTLIVLGAACAGSFWASLHLGWWQRLPAHDAVVLADTLGWPGALALQLAVFGALALLLRHLALPAPATPPAQRSWRALLSGPWPAVAGALLLALGNLWTLVVAGHPWSITWGFTLWGAKVAMLAGWQPASSAFWQGGWQREVLAGSVLDDTTSMMDLALMLGALCAASLAGRFAPQWRLPWRSLAAALLGGLAIGYGARIAYGCNIGAFLSGVASGSLHGWLWIVAALPGTWVGIALRRRFGLPD